MDLARVNLLIILFTIPSTVEVSTGIEHETSSIQVDDSTVFLDLFEIFLLDASNLVLSQLVKLVQLLLLLDGLLLDPAHVLVHLVPFAELDCGGLRVELNVPLDLLLDSLLHLLLGFRLVFSGNFFHDLLDILQVVITLQHLDLSVGKTYNPGPLPLVFDDLTRHIRNQLSHQNFRCEEQVFGEHENQHNLEESAPICAV